jgi:predicted nucleic acid-binding protein
MSFLLDTNVLSEIRKPKHDANVQRWFRSVEDSDLYLSVLVVGEIRQGVERLRRRDPKRATAYESWLADLRLRYRERIVPISSEIAEEWGRRNVPDPLGVVDGLLAATAKVIGLTLVTRNTADVARTGVAVLDPFEAPA